MIPVTARDLLILAYCALFNPGLLSGLGLFWSKREAIREKWGWIQTDRRTVDQETHRGSVRIVGARREQDGLRGSLRFAPGTVR